MTFGMIGKIFLIMNIVLLEYEATENLDLQFYGAEYLDSEIKKSNSGSSMGFIFKPDIEIGINGLRNRVCMVLKVNKDFNGIFNIELFSRAIIVAEETIRINEEN